MNAIVLLRIISRFWAVFFSLIVVMDLLNSFRDEPARQCNLSKLSSSLTLFCGFVAAVGLIEQTENENLVRLFHFSFIIIQPFFLISFTNFCLF